MVVRALRQTPWVSIDIGHDGEGGVLNRALLGRSVWVWSPPYPLSEFSTSDFGQIHLN